MREIKFRAWYKPDKEMVEIHQINWENGFEGGLSFSHESFWHNDSKNYFLMQYTGIKDVKGREIYEGDILKTFKREWIDGTRLEPGIYELTYNSSCFWLNDLPFYGYVEYKRAGVEILGNIYENGDLLNGK